MNRLDTIKRKTDVLMIKWQEYFRFPARLAVLLFVITLAVHSAAALAIHISNFYPSGSGRDDLYYHQMSQELVGLWASGHIGIPDTFQAIFQAPTAHWYVLLLGNVYDLTWPSLLVGRLFSALLAALSAVLLFALMRRIGAEAKRAFWMSLIVGNLYLSFIFFGSLTLKDTVILPLVLGACLFFYRLIEQFDWRDLTLMLLLVQGLLLLRLYLGMVILFAFFLVWPLVAGGSKKERAWRWLNLTFLSALLLQFNLHSFLGIKTVHWFLVPERVENLRSAAYAGGSSYGVVADYSSLAGFLTFYVKSFANVFFGPWPWLFKQTAHYALLAESIPWAAAVGFLIFRWRTLLAEYKKTLPVIVFGLGLIAAIALFSDNAGANLRLRIPAYFCLASLLPLVWSKKR